MKNKIYRIKVSGLVQGIGFRPFVAELAESLELAGQVKNLGGMVEIMLLGDEKTVDVFIQRLCLAGGYIAELSQGNSGGKEYVLKDALPISQEESEFIRLPGCRLDSLEVEILENERKDTLKVSQQKDFEANQVMNGEKQFDWWNGKFHIVESGSGREVRRFLPVDLPTCDRCVAEMHDKENRRYRYPFISCTSCGPRFSIQKAVPYDRDTITMDDFPMCKACEEEYMQKGNIRRHAQTIACKDCGPRLKFVTTREAYESFQRGGIREESDDFTEFGRDFAIENFAIENFTAENMQDFIYISDEQQAISEAIHALKNDKIGAIKDIGGYHFAFSPYSAKAASRLRAFKNRDKKPFAVMFLNLEEVKEYCEVSEKEAEILTSSARPIVLLKKKILNEKKDFVLEVCGDSDRIGALLPCNPLQILLLEETGSLVMTSGNRGGEPIIISEEEMQQYVGNGIDFMLTHDREILTPLDDTIYQVTDLSTFREDMLPGDSLTERNDAWNEDAQDMFKDFVLTEKDDARNVNTRKICMSKSRVYADEKKRYAIQLIRRARGLAPEPITLNRKLPKDTFAAGGDLKAVFGLGREELVYLSQYFGDLEDVRCAESREKGIYHMMKLLEIQPKYSVGDLHPAYFSAQNMQKKVQHHHAHAASVIAEHGLTGKVLGIACDGTGYGTDGTIWGSEFLLCENKMMLRVGHFSSVKLIGGDASAKQADLTLYSYMLEARERGLDVEAFFTECENACVDAEGNFDAVAAQRLKLQEMAWKQNINAVKSSSMGRLFDAAAALLEICVGNSYEGECAISLEQAGHEGKRAISLEQAGDKGKNAVSLGQVGHNRKCETETWQNSDDRKEIEVFKGILNMQYFKEDGIWQADSVRLLADLYHLKKKYSKEVLAYLFHHAVACAIVEIADMICKEQNTNQVALSGGTFINRILLKEVFTGLFQRGREVYINEKVPCGDGGIALGQMYLASF